MSKEDYKERQRVTKACDNCRKKKIKCGQYLDPTKKRGPPKGAGRYINAIEDRLHRMEAIVGGLVREDDPLLQSNEELRALLAGTPLRSRGSRDSYNEAHHGASTNDQPQQYLQHPDHSDLEHQHHPPPLHDYETLMNQGSQQQQLPIQYPLQQQFLQHQNQQQQQFPNRVLDTPLGHSPDMAPQSLPEGTQQNNDAARTSSFHRDLMRDNSLQSFNSPSPVLSSDHSVADFADSPTTASETIPKAGMSTPAMDGMDELEDDLGHLTLDRMGRERYVGKSSPMFYAGRHYVTGLHISAMHPETEKPAARKFVDNLELPSPEVMTHLLNLHFTYVHPFMPVFVTSKFLKRIQDREYTPSFLFLLNSIFALAARYSDDISFRTDPAKPETVGDRFADKAREILDTLYDSPDLYCVGALCLLAFQQMGTGNGYRAWMYVGISIRMAQHLGLNRNCLKLNPHMPMLDREERNRIWWTCFTADRIISVSFGRPQGITEADVDATYPEGIDENTQLEFKLEGATSSITGPPPHSEKNFVYMASLMRILGRVMVSLYTPLSRASSKSTASMTNPAPLEQLDKELTDWLLTLPPHLQFQSVQQAHGTFVCTLHMTFYAVLILLHRPYSHRSSHNTPNDPSISLAICTSAANNTIEMASNMMRAIDDKRGVSRLKCLLHNCVYIFFTAGLVHITNCTSTDPALAASAKLRTIETLRCMAIVEDVWITGRWCANNIKQLLKARNIELPFSSEAFKNLPLGSVEELKKKLETGSPQTETLSTGSTTPKEQTYAYDIDQIMGYYHGAGPRHAEPMGRNSRHFSPTPYFSPSANHHHHHQSQTPMKSHPGLSQGHAPLPRRPRHGKNTSPSPGVSSVSLVSSSAGPSQTNGFFPCLQETAAAIGAGATLNNSTVSNTPSNANALLDPFATPGSATVTGANGMQQSAMDNSQQRQQQQQQQQSLNLYQNPFSSSLWGLPTSMDTDEWMLYVQNSGAGQGGAMDLSVDDQGSTSSSVSSGSVGSTPIKSEPSMFGPLGDLNATLLDQSTRPHPLAQSMSRSDLFGSEAAVAINTSTAPITSTTAVSASMSSIPDHPLAMETPVSSMSALSKGFTATSQEPISMILAGHTPPHVMTSQALLTTPQPSEYFYLGGPMGMTMSRQQVQEPYRQL
ncbi:hypothetical protein BGX31_008375 [Mortierella sp. GBA43]|nr:hypothetical protein BGX31_008375 [Mortierella sp. GBA43]